MPNLAIVKAYHNAEPRQLWAVVPVYTTDIDAADASLIEHAKQRLQCRFSSKEAEAAIFRVEWAG